MTSSISEEICLSELASDRRCITEIAAPYRIVHVNSSWCQCTGYTQSEVIGRTCKMLQGKDTCRHTMRVLDVALKELRPITVRLINYRKDEMPFVNDLTVVPLRDATTKVATHFLGVIREHVLPGSMISPSITSALSTLGGIGMPEEMKPPRIPTQLQEALRNEVSHPQMITERAAPHKIIHVNAAWCHTCGYRAEELLGRPYTILHGPQTEPGLQPLLKQAFLAGQQVTCKATYYTKSQQPKQSHVTISPLLDTAGIESHYYVHLLTSPQDQPFATQTGFPSHLGNALNSSIGQLGALQGVGMLGNGGPNGYKPTLLTNGLSDGLSDAVTEALAMKNGASVAGARSTIGGMNGHHKPHFAIEVLNGSSNSADLLLNGSAPAHSNGSSMNVPNLNGVSSSSASSSSATSLLEAERSGNGGVPAAVATSMSDPALSSSLLGMLGGGKEPGGVPAAMLSGLHANGAHTNGLHNNGLQHNGLANGLANGLFASATPLVNGLQSSLLATLPAQALAQLVTSEGATPGAADLIKGTGHMVELSTRLLQKGLQGPLPFGMGAASGSRVANNLALNSAAGGGANSLALAVSAAEDAPCAASVSLASSLANGATLPTAGPGSLVHAVANAQVKSMVQRMTEEGSGSIGGLGGASVAPTPAALWEHPCVAQALSASSGPTDLPVGSASPSMSLLTKLTAPTAAGTACASAPGLAPGSHAVGALAGAPGPSGVPFEVTAATLAAYVPNFRAHQQLGAPQPLAPLLPPLPLAPQAPLQCALTVGAHQATQHLGSQGQQLPELVARGENGARVPPFLTKLYTIVNDVEYNEYASWVRNGSAFCISNPQAFADRCLPRFFKHNKMGSFQQQLLTYGFQRVPNESVLDISCVWQHTYFKEGHPELLDKINRQGAKRSSTQQEDDPTEDDASKMQSNLNRLCNSLHELHHELRTARVVEMRAIDSLMLKVTKRMRPLSEWVSPPWESGSDRPADSGSNQGSAEGEESSRSGESGDGAGPSSKPSSESGAVQHDNLTADTGLDTGADTSADSSSAGDAHESDDASHASPSEPSAEPELMDPMMAVEPMMEVAAVPEVLAEAKAETDSYMSGAKLECEGAAGGAAVEDAGDSL